MLSIFRNSACCLVVWCISGLVITITAKTFNVKDFGATGDGTHIDSPAINTAIEKATENGHGIVLIPKGTYLCYSIHLKSNLTLHLEEEATILAAKAGKDGGYDVADYNPWDKYQDFGHSHWKNSLIWGIGLNNIRIEGKGIIDGTEGLHLGLSFGGNIHRADKGIAMKNCTNVEVKDITMLTCGHMAMLFTGVDNLQLSNITIDSNRDGIDIDCCENVKVRNCHVNTHNDDAIVLKSSYALGKLKPTRNVVIDKCHVSGFDHRTYYNGTFTTLNTKAPDQGGPTGRIKIGTESNGGFYNIIIKNCTFTHCRGLALETVDGAEMKNVRVKNLTMRDIGNSPIYIRIGNRMRGPEGLPLSTIHDISISNVRVDTCDSHFAMLIVGDEDNPVRDITLKNVRVSYLGGTTLEDVRTQKGANNFFLKYDIKYPEPFAHGIQPAWGLSMQHVRNITFKNVNLTLLTPDERPKTYLDDVEGFKY